MSNPKAEGETAPQTGMDDPSPINPPTEGDKEAAAEGNPPMTPEEEQEANTSGN